MITVMVITSVNVLFAQSPIYLEISDCTKEFQYVYSEPNGVEATYFTYQFTLNEFETVVLEASTYDSKTISSSALIANNRLTCNEALENQLSVETIEKIQAGKQDIYLLKPNKDGFMVLNVTDAIYQVYLPDDKYLRVVTRAYEFDYDGQKTYETGADLKTAGEGDLVLFQEESIDCYDKPTFMHVPVNFMETANIEYVLGLGIVKQYSDLMEHRLVAIDGQPIYQYLITLCNPDATVTETVEASTEVYVETAPEKPTLVVPDITRETVVEGVNMSLVEEGVGAVMENTTSEGKGNTVIYKSIPVSREAISKKNIHIVSAGETLYSISKKYNLTTTQLKAMNQLEEDTIEIGQRLKIKE